jgi:hypothetical protein
MLPLDVTRGWQSLNTCFHYQTIYSLTLKIYYRSNNLVKATPNTHSLVLINGHLSLLKIQHLTKVDFSKDINISFYVRL